MTKTKRTLSGKGIREKGKRFERAWAAVLREWFPQYADEIHRSIQSRGPEACDVIGLPGYWFECQDAVTVTPIAKLVQAERDLALSDDTDRTPIAITHRTGSRSTQATLRTGDLLHLFANLRLHNPVGKLRHHLRGRLPIAVSSLPITLDAEDLLMMIRHANGW